MRELYLRIGEALHIGDDILVTVVEIQRGYRAQVGVEARNHQVYRGEVYERKKRELHEARKSR